MITATEQAARARVTARRRHAELLATTVPPRRTVAPRVRYGRCACGRPINTPGAIECAECD